jgi:hypothetical protein
MIRLFFAVIFVVATFAGCETNKPVPVVPEVKPIANLNKAEESVSSFLRDYKSGMGKIYREAADKIDREEIVDIKSLLLFINPSVESLKERAGSDMERFIEGVNGNSWDPDNAAQLMRDFATGFEDD